MSTLALHTTNPAAIERAAQHYRDLQAEQANAEAAPHERTVDDVRDELVALFLDVMARGPEGADTMMPATVRFNATPEHCTFDVWNFRRVDKPIRILVRQFTDTNSATAAFDALLFANPSMVEHSRQLFMRRIAREYADAEADGLFALGWELES